MKAIIHPSTLSGQIKVPTSKSMMQRALLLALLNNGKTVLEYFTMSEDDIAMLNIIKSLGAKVELKENKIVIDSNGIFPAANEINVGESGLAARLLIPVLSTQSEQFIINGKGSLLKRKMNAIENVFKKLKVEFSTNENHLPVKIKGPIQLQEFDLDGSNGSQFISGLLIAIGYSTKHKFEFTVSNAVSKPYIVATIEMMRNFGYEITHRNYEKFTLVPQSKAKKDIHLKIESDWSSAAILSVAAAISGDLSLIGLNKNSVQADKKILDLLELANVQFECNDEVLIVKKSEINSFNFNCIDCPDLFPAAVVLASFAIGQSRISGLNRLVDKESNRALTLQSTFKNFGVEIEFENDEMIIKGKGRVDSSKELNSFNDHRIAMAATIAAICGNGISIVENAESVSKSYPNFYNDLQSVGANILIEE